VLIVDDEPSARELLVNYLQPEGYETLVADSRAQAVEIARRWRPDAITLNMLTPGKAGWKTLQELKSDPQTAAIPVVLVSVIDRRRMGFALGAAEYLLKPVPKDALMRALRKHVRPSSEAQPCVLVVDDDPDDLQMMSEVLDSAGFRTVTALGGRRALELMADFQPGAILLDLLMPDVDGFEVIRRVREDESLRDTPILVLTAKELTDVDLHTLRRETASFFDKGTSWKQELLEQLRRSTAGPQCLHRDDEASRDDARAGMTARVPERP